MHMTISFSTNFFFKVFQIRQFEFENDFHQSKLVIVKNFLDKTTGNDLCLILNVVSRIFKDHQSLNFSLPVISCWQCSVNKNNDLHLQSVQGKVGRQYFIYTLPCSMVKHIRVSLDISQISVG